MSVWDTMADIGVGVGTGGVGLLVKKGIQGKGPLSDLAGNPTSHTDAYVVDNNDYNYGGSVGGADEAAGNYRRIAAGTMGTAGDLQNQAQGLQANQGADRNAQIDALELQRQAALGNAPSRAELLARAQGDRAMSAQTSAAASARTPAGIAMAQQQAAANMARQQTDIANNTAGMRADEMANARGAFGGQANALRGSDQANQALLQQGALGYHGATQGYLQGERDVRQQQLQGSMDRSKTQANIAMGVQAANNAAAEKGKENQTKMAMEGAKAAGQIVAGASDERVKNFLPSMQSSVGGKDFLGSFGGGSGGGAVGGSAGGTMQDIGGAIKSVGPMMPGSDAQMGGNPQFLNTAIPAILGMLSDERTKTYDGGIPKVERDAAEKAFTQVADPSRAPTGSGVVGLGTMARLDALRHGVDPDAGYTGAVPPPDPALAKGMEEHLQATRPSAYTYKDGYGTPGVHIGPPSAQQMAKNPVGATMIQKDKSGTLAIDMPRAVKTTMSATAYVNDKVKSQQQQIDALEAMIRSRNEGYAKSDPATAGALARVRGEGQ